MLIPLFLKTLSFGTASVSAALVETGQTFMLNDIPYYIPPKPILSLGPYASFNSRGITPMTVVAVSSAKYGDDELSRTLRKYNETDDVWQHGFLGGLYVQYSTNECSKSPKFSSLPQHTAVMTSCHSGISSVIPPGPYFMKHDELYAAYRVYSDVQQTFSEPLIADPDGSFSVAPVYVTGQSLSCPVPSRLYYTKTKARPLAGTRLIVKDIYDIRGTRTGNGNRAWYHLYPAAAQTAPAVQNLINAGAIVIGKSKTSQFANGERATADWVDYHAPFNPRGDGYQNPSSSSSGPGAGEGAYDWVDLAIGSDTGGSVRGPSQVQGLYGNRPTHGLVNLGYTMPLAPQLDTAGLLARDPQIWAAGAKALYGDNITFTSSYPPEILTVNFPETNDTEADRLLIGFLSKLEGFLGARVSTFNITTAWSSNPPPQTSVNLDRLLNLTYPTLITLEQIRLVRDPFYVDYATTHDGRLPFVDPVPLARWQFGENTDETVESAERNKTIFQDWFSKNVLSRCESTCSNRLILYVGSTAEPFPRNEYFSPPSVPFGFGTSRWSPLWGGPDYVLPIGQAAFFSNVTMHKERLPVTVDILAARDCDGMLFSLVLDLYEAGILTAQEAGMSNVDGGEILFKRF